MSVYFDSSALIAVYVNEAHSERAREELRKHIPVPWTPIHELEVRTGLRLLHGRGMLEEHELHGLLAHVDDDLRTGRFERSELELTPVFHRAGQMSKAHASRTLARTLDILHLAALAELGCTRLVSGDERQIALAEAVGIQVSDIRS